jgi:hypothetical protein
MASISRFITIVVFGVLVIGLAGSAQAIPTTLYGNNASFGPDLVEKFDLQNNGAKLGDYVVSNGNGRGCVVVGNVLYTTQVGDGNIYKTDINTSASLGTISTSLSSMSTLAWDGSGFWMADYSGTNQAFHITTGGAVDNTITLSLATGYTDGLEYFNGKLIANRTDGGFGGNIIYDIYDLSGNVLSAGFITAPNGTGIAYDGQNFIVSDIFNNQVNYYDGTNGGWLQAQTLGGSNPYGSRFLEDLSVDYTQVQPVPEPATFFLMGGGLLALGIVRRKRARK